MLADLPQPLVHLISFLLSSSHVPQSSLSLPDERPVIALERL